MKDPCPNCPWDEQCKKVGGSRYLSCGHWNVYFRERWAYINAYAKAHNIQPTTPPEEVNEFDEESAGSDS